MATLADQWEAKAKGLEDGTIPLSIWERPWRFDRAQKLRAAAARIRAEIAECEAEGDRAP